MSREIDEDFNLVRPGLWKHPSGHSIHYGNGEKTYTVMNKYDRLSKHRTLNGAKKAIINKMKLKEDASANMQEGIKDYLPSTDSISAFGRNAADTATFGGYKYARAGADYAAKKGMKALGLSKQDTTYKRELDQEKQKLARDDVKNPRASAAGDIAGMGAMAIAPEIPAVGAALGSALKGGETASKIPYYARLVKKAIGLREDAPVNNAGDSNIAGLGVGPKGEPGRPARLMPMLRRSKFAGNTVFEVKSDVFHKAVNEKRKGQHWKKYLGEDEYCAEIREYANKNPGKAIMIQDENSGYITAVRYGKRK